MDRARPLNVLIAGGGVAALETALALRELAAELTAPVLIAPGDTFAYRPAIVAELFGFGVVHRFDLTELAGDCGAARLHDAVRAVHPDQRVVVTADGARLPYDALVLAMGAELEPAVPGAAALGLDGGTVRAIAADLRACRTRRLVVAVPAGTTWALPAYEAALFLADLARRHGAPVEITLVTPEERPLAVFGRAAGDEVTRMLAEQAITLVTGVSPIAFEHDQLTVSPAGRIGADSVLALPRLLGPQVTGVPTDAAGFIRTDRFGRVDELADVYAAGDVTAYPVKQGGLAAQQADVVARTIASEAGAPVEPVPFKPVLRGLLLGLAEPRYLRSEIEGGHGDTSTVSTRPMWWPPSKIAGRYLAPFLAERLAEDAVDDPSNVG
jgi:sulfide:quinone oxidoreductase